MTSQGVWSTKQDKRDLFVRAAAIEPSELKQLVDAAADGIDKILQNTTDKQLKTELSEAKASLQKDFKGTGKVTRGVVELESDDDDDDNSKYVRGTGKEPTKRQNLPLRNGSFFSTGRYNFLRTFDIRRYNLNLRRYINNLKQNKGSVLGIKSQWDFKNGWSFGTETNGLQFKSKDDRFTFRVEPNLSGEIVTSFKLKF